MSEKGKIDRMADKKLHGAHGGHEDGMRGKLGRGHELPGLGKQRGAVNVVNEHSHAEKMKHC